MRSEQTPVIAGVGQVTVRNEPLDALSTPLDLMQRAVQAACGNAGLGQKRLADLDEIAVVKSFREPMRNTPAALAQRLGANRASQWLTPNGGNMPQALVNRFCHKIAQGKAGFVLLTGAEAIDNARRLIKSGQKPNWSLPAETDPAMIFPDREMVSAHEKMHGIWLAAHVYPLFENALRGFYKRSIADQQRVMGELFAKFSRVAARSSYAWFPQKRSADEIATPGPKNRYVGWPYTKFMNAMNQINQSAALLLTSVAQARAWGIPEERLIYLHGYADTTELWHVLERVNYHTAPSINRLAEKAFSMASMNSGDVDCFDIYSCFPSAVEIARDALGLAEDDPRPLTVTGGLPFHGGAGNNYSMNAIASMVEKLRQEPGTVGMVTANGGYLSKHAAGIYSTRPVSPERFLQPVAEDRPNEAGPPLVETPDGAGVVETYTVTFGRDGAPERGIVIGRLGAAAEPMAPRFAANLPADRVLLEAVTQDDFLGHSGHVRQDGSLNLFDPA